MSATDFAAKLQALGAPFQGSLDEGYPGLGWTSWGDFGPGWVLLMAYSCLKTSQNYASLHSREEDQWVTSPSVAGAKHGEESPTLQPSHNLTHHLRALVPSM